MIWSIFFEKNAFFDPILGQHAAKMASIGGCKGPILGFRRSQTIWEPIKNELEQFFEKNAFFDPKSAFSPIYRAKMGSTGGSTGSILGF